MVDLTSNSSVVNDLYHMTRMGPTRTLIVKVLGKSRMRAVCDVGESRPVLLASRTALCQMRTETTLLLYKSDSLVKMSDVSEHSDSEFYYPKKERKIVVVI